MLVISIKLTSLVLNLNATSTCVYIQRLQKPNAVLSLRTRRWNLPPVHRRLVLLGRFCVPLNTPEEVEPPCET